MIEQKYQTYRATPYTEIITVKGVEYIIDIANGLREMIVRGRHASEADRFDNGILVKFGVKDINDSERESVKLDFLTQQERILEYMERERDMAMAWRRHRQVSISSPERLSPLIMAFLGLGYQ